jgi:hypothetical protein
MIDALAKLKGYILNKGHGLQEVYYEICDLFFNLEKEDFPLGN